MLLQQHRLVHRLFTRRLYATHHQPGITHSQWYTDLVPAMVPIALLGSAVYLGLQLTQSTLSHEKYLVEARERVKELEAQVESLQQQRESQTQTRP